MVARAVWLFTFLVAVGCAPQHRVVIDVRVDGANERVAEIALELSPADGGPTLRAWRTIGPNDDLARGVRAAVIADVPNGTTLAQLHLLDASGTRLASHAMTLEVRRTSMFLFHVDEECAETICDGGLSCENGTCGEARRGVEQPVDLDPLLPAQADAGPPSEDAGPPERDAGERDAGPGGGTVSLIVRSSITPANAAPEEAQRADGGGNGDGGSQDGDRPRQGYQGPMQQPAPR